MKRPLALVIIAICLFFALFQMWRGFHDVADTDYIGFVTAARVLESGSHCVYCDAVHHQAEEAYLGISLPANVVSGFGYPAPVLLPLVPLGHLRPAEGFAIFDALAFIASAIAAWLLMSRFGSPELSMESRVATVVLGVWSLPASWGLALGQVDPILVLVAAAGMIMVRRKPSVLAGLVLALVFLKPQLGWMLVPLFMAVGEWRLVAGMLAGALAWLLGTIALVGTSSVHDLMNLIVTRAYGEASHTIGIPGLAGSLFQSSLVTFVVAFIGVLVCCLVVWRQREIWRRDPVALVAMGFALSVVLSPHIWSLDLIMFAPLLTLWSRVAFSRSLDAGIALSGAYMLDLILPAGLAHVEALAGVLIVYAFWTDIVREGRSSNHTSTAAVTTIQADSA